VTVADRCTRKDRSGQIRKPVDEDFPDRHVTVVPGNPRRPQLRVAVRDRQARANRSITPRTALAFTPPRSSWLNMAEIGIGALPRHRPDRSRPGRAALKREAAVWQEERNAGKARPKRRFTAVDASHPAEVPVPGHSMWTIHWQPWAPTLASTGRSKAKASPAVRPPILPRPTSPGATVRSSASPPSETEVPPLTSSPWAVSGPSPADPRRSRCPGSAGRSPPR